LRDVSHAGAAFTKAAWGTPGTRHTHGSWYCACLNNRFPLCQRGFAGGRLCVRRAGPAIFTRRGSSCCPCRASCDGAREALLCWTGCRFRGHACWCRSIHNIPRGPKGCLLEQRGQRGFAGGRLCVRRAGSAVFTRRGGSCCPCRASCDGAGEALLCCTGCRFRGRACRRRRVHSIPRAPKGCLLEQRVQRGLGSHTPLPCPKRRLGFM